MIPWIISGVAVVAAAVFCGLWRMEARYRHVELAAAQRRAEKAIQREREKALKPGNN